MSRPITDMETTWRERLNKLMKDKDLSQYKFSVKYTEKYGNGEKKTSQADVCKWLKVGLPYKKPNGETAIYGFPTLKTMRNIADFFGVSVSYLIGESDYETYDMEKACKYTGLSPAAIKQIRSIAKPKKISNVFSSVLLPVPIPSRPFVINDARKPALELLLTSPSFGDYLGDIHDLLVAIKHEKQNTNTLQYVADRIPEEYKEDTFAVFDTIMRDKPISESGVEPSETVMKLVELMELGCDITNGDRDKAAMKVEVAKYTLTETHLRMIQELIKNSRKDTPDDNTQTEEQTE